MWFAIFIPIFIFRVEIAGENNCMVQIPKITRQFKTYLKEFHWLTPADNFNGTKFEIAHGEKVEFNCENGFVNDDLLGSSYTFECTDGKFNKTFDYKDLLCKSDFHKNTRTFQISSVLVGSKILKCEGKGLEVYQVKTVKPDGKLKHLYTVCFDKKVMRTKFVFQPAGNERRQPYSESRKDVWGFDRFGKTAVEKLKLSGGYVTKIQRNRITKAFPNKYNRKRQYPYNFNRGHLAPYADFLDDDDRKASCEYINVAPQWREFNGNTWSLIERQTREMVRDNPGEWEIYTGTYGSIPTTRGPLFVSHFFDDNGKFIKGFVPVPKLYWKLVHNVVDNNSSRAFVGVNNPELKSPDEFTDKYLICKPKLGEGKRFFQGSEFKGFTYECGVDEFLQKLGKDENILKVSELQPGAPGPRKNKKIDTDD